MPIFSLTSDALTQLLRTTNVKGLVDFAKLSTVMAALVRDEMRRRVLVKLGEDFLHPTDLLQALEDFDGVLAGKWLLSLLDPSAMEVGARVDILVGDTQFTAFVQWLEAHESIRLDRLAPVVPEFTAGSYRYALEFRGLTADVRIIRSSEPNPYHLVAHYVSTHLMNYLAATHLVVAYPELTFTRRGILLGNYIKDDLVGDFVVAERPAITGGAACRLEEGCGMVMRWFNDEQCVVMDIDFDVVVDGQIHWRLGGLPCNDECEDEARLVGNDNEFD